MSSFFDHFKFYTRKGVPTKKCNLKNKLILIEYQENLIIFFLFKKILLGFNWSVGLVQKCVVINILEQKLLQ